MCLKIEKKLDATEIPTKCDVHFIREFCAKHEFIQLNFCRI